MPNSLLTEFFSYSFAMFADVLLPIAISGAYTYSIPHDLVPLIQVGSRVLVPLKNKIATAIVVRLYSDAPNISTDKLRDIADLVDEHPLLLENQIQFWRWLAQYYMCYPGEVMDAALPSGLKLKSESFLSLNLDAFETENQFTPIESQLFTRLQNEKLSISEIQQKIPAKGLHTCIKRWIECGKIEVDERISQTFKVAQEVHLRLANSYDSPEAFKQLIEQTKAERQVEVLKQFARISHQLHPQLSPQEALQKSIAQKQLTDFLPHLKSTIATLVKKGILERFQLEVERLQYHVHNKTILHPPQLNSPQTQALIAIQQAWENKNTILLHGVTSSGKTEIYTHLIRKSLDKGQQVLFLLPEIALTSQITTRLGHFFGQEMGVYHSKFPDNIRIETWHKQLSENPYSLIVGVRSALFLPFQRLGLIIVDEEHESSYKQQDPAPRYHARDAAIVLAQQLGAKVLLGTATPSLESYHNALQGKFALVRLTQRFGNVQMPHIVVEDTAELHRKRQMPSPFSPRLQTETRTTLARGEQAIFFLNRRGYSPVLSCKACAWTPRCQMCDVALTLHQREGKMVCHYCGTSYPIPQQCPQCTHTELRDLGAGTEKIEHLIEEIFPMARPARLDLDTTRTRSAQERIIKDFQSGKTNLLIGTQMVTKGLDFDKVSLVGILNADQMLNQCDFRAHERAYQMMTQVAGRAGRRQAQGTVILQTAQADLPLLQHIVRHDYEAMYQHEMQERQRFAFPPFVRLIAIHFKHKNENTVAAAAQAFALQLRPFFGQQLLGPDKPLVGFVKKQHLRKLLLKIDTRYTPASIRKTLNNTRSLLTNDPRFKTVVCYFDVDPL